MTSLADRFLKPQNPQQRRYEALRARFVDNCTITEAAGRFGYTDGTMRNMCAEFQNAQPPYFSMPKTARPAKAKPQKADPRQTLEQRIVELRRRNLSVYDIQCELKNEKLSAGVATIHGVLKRRGLPRLARRTFEQRAAAEPLEAPVADVGELDLSPREIRTDFAGLFLFVPDLLRLDLSAMLRHCRWPGSAQLPADCAVRSLLALKLWGIGRPWHVSSHTLDPGLALFAGLNVIPKRSTLTEYSCRVEPSNCRSLTDTWHDAVDRLDVSLGGGHSFDLDFHTIPFHGDDALIEKHYVSKRSRSQKGILALVARDADARVLCFADATIRKADFNDAVLRFVEHFHQHNERYPAELMFDSRFTTHANLGRLDELGIGFATPRRRTAKMTAQLLATPSEQWRQVRLSNIGRAYRNPRVLDQTVTLKAYPGDLRQLTVTGLGHDQPTVLLTNQMQVRAADLIDRYARRMLIENTIEDAINFFHMDALSAAVPLRIDTDLQLTLMASALYRILGVRVGNGMAVVKSQTIFRKLVQASGSVRITPTEIVVRLGRRAHNPLLLAAGYHKIRETVPWLGNRTLRIEFF